MVSSPNNLEMVGFGYFSLLTKFYTHQVKIGTAELHINKIVGQQQIYCECEIIVKVKQGLFEVVSDVALLMTEIH